METLRQKVDSLSWGSAIVLIAGAVVIGVAIFLVAT